MLLGHLLPQITLQHMVQMPFVVTQLLTMMHLVRVRCTPTLLVKET